MSETGETMSYAFLDACSNRVAHLLRSRGIQRGDTIAIWLDNRVLFFGLVWGAQRAGVHFVCLPVALTGDEARYILDDSGARLVFASAALTRKLSDTIVATLCVEDRDFLDQLDAFPTTPIADESAGIDMLYSSGTTGQPKGIRLPLPDPSEIDAPDVLGQIARGYFGLGPDSVYLCPAPLYHAAPLRWTMAVHRLGGTVVLMPHFEPGAALAAIEQYRVTHSQWVPTHFVRMLKLDDTLRTRHDLSSHRVAIHAAAPCPIEIKRSMLEWWGPIIHEYYAASEGIGMTMISATDWLDHPGSVGRAVYGKVHVCDENGEELPADKTGLVYFEHERDFAYHNDPAKTQAAKNARGWTTLGDIGRVDEEGYLYLTDRQSFMIISGGVNIYPQEIEDRIVVHPKVADVAVIGVACADMGEEVVAVIQPAAGTEPGAALASEIEAWARQSLAGYKVPRRIEFTTNLPRTPTGKLLKRKLRGLYAKQPVQ